MPPASPREYAFDGLVGPTHDHSGLSLGNLASLSHVGERANPRAAALEGLAKLRLVGALGVPQAVLPPHERPHLPTLRCLGFTGTDADVLAKVHDTSPALLRQVSSASSMWAANAATVAPSSDTRDGRLHLTPANLTSMFHRSLEAATSERVLRRLFRNPAHFEVHAPLPAHPDYGDEGAANHTRLVTSRGSAHLFGWGREPDAERLPVRFPARQSRAASAAVARLNALEPGRALLWQQHPDGIDSGAFHSDVLAVGSGNLLILHELAFVEPAALERALRALLGDELRWLLVRDSELPVADAVAAYPFNSELVTAADGTWCLIAPRESEQRPAARRFLERLVADGYVGRVAFADVNGSMKNGGGPACLRLRIPLTDAQRGAVTARVFFDAELDRELVDWVERHYRDRLALDDLRDPAFLDETRRALDELSTLLGLGSVYEFQR